VVALLPYPGPARRARQPLDRDRVVQAALTLMDRVGLDGLTMRCLADELGVTAGSMYRHVRDKDELLVLLADALAGQVPLVARHVPWQQALFDMGVAYRQVLLRHRDAARLLASTPPAGPLRLRRIEAILEVLVAAGFADRVAAWAAYHFNNLVTESVADEVRLTAAAAVAGTDRGELLARARAELRGLPADQFPTLIRLADDVATDDAEALFAFGLRLLTRGLESVHASLSP
jgi:TetR/AcrR family transcriptional regulator, tetracycline repressor protein